MLITIAHGIFSTLLLTTTPYSQTSENYQEKNASDVTPRTQGAPLLKIPSGHDCVHHSSSTYKCDVIGYKIFQAVGNKMPIFIINVT